MIDDDGGRDLRMAYNIATGTDMNPGSDFRKWFYQCNLAKRYRFKARRFYWRGSFEILIWPSLVGREDWGLFFKAKIKKGWIRIGNEAITERTLQVRAGS